MSSSSQSAPSSRRHLSDVLAVVIIGLLALVLGVLAAVFNPLLNDSPGAEGARIDTLFSVLLGLGTFVFVIIQGGILYAVIRFRQRGDDENDPEPVHGNRNLEIVWTAIPAGIVAIIALFSFIILTTIEQPAPNEMVVEVTGRQFSWEFYYPDRDLRSNELHVPRDQQVHLRLRSADVAHAFWVPDFRIKKDLLPDRVTDAWITPEKSGTYAIVCAELCGAGHAVMRSQMVVEELASFEAWARRQAQPPVDPNDPIAFGRQTFTKYGCNACHVLSDANAAGAAGPTLDGIGATAASREPGKSAEEHIREAIVDPNRFLVPNFPAIMPQDFGQRMSEQELNALVTYLASQR